MKLMLYRFAHAEEVHTDGLESITHYGDAWYIAIPVFLIISATIGYLTWLVSGKNFGTVLLVLAGFFLIIGFGLFSISPIVSAIAIVCGMLIAGFLALAGLSSGK
jgi:hypothetical protein